MAALTRIGYIHWAIAGVIFFCAGGCWHTDSLARRTAAPREMPGSSLAGGSTMPELDDAARADIALTVARGMELEGKSQKAIQAYMAVADAYDVPEAYHRLAVLHDMREDFEQSAQYYQQALRRSPNDPKVLCDVGYSYYLQGRLDESEKFLRLALKAAPAEAIVHNNLGLTLGRSGQYEEAFEHFFAASSSRAEARVNLAYSMLRNRRYEDAREQLHLALREDDKLSAASDLLAAVESRLNLDRPTDSGRQQVQLAAANQADHGSPQTASASTPAESSTIRIASLPSPNAAHTVGATTAKSVVRLPTVESPSAVVNAQQYAEPQPQAAPGIIDVNDYAMPAPSAESARLGEATVRFISPTSTGKEN